MKKIALVLGILITGCSVTTKVEPDVKVIPEPDHFLTSDQTHSKFSSSIPPVLTLPQGMSLR